MVLPSSGKLVRDGIPGVIEQSGGDPEVVLLSREQLLDALGVKLLEEAHEYLAAPEGSARLEELADIYEVVLALVRENGATWSDLVETAERKREERGGFVDGVWLL